jgi:hypothetical protein
MRLFGERRIKGFLYWRPAAMSLVNLSMNAFLFLPAYSKIYLFFLLSRAHEPVLSDHASVLNQQVDRLDDLGIDLHKM